jgi:hypothetical protein
MSSSRKYIRLPLACRSNLHQLSPALTTNYDRIGNVACIACAVCLRWLASGRSTSRHRLRDLIRQGGVGVALAMTGNLVRPLPNRGGGSFLNRLQPFLDKLANRLAARGESAEALPIIVDSVNHLWRQHDDGSLCVFRCFSHRGDHGSKFQLCQLYTLNTVFNL